MPSPVEVAPDAIPMPEAWGSPKSLEELFQPIPQSSGRTNRKSPKQTSKPEKEKRRSIRCRIPRKQCRTG